MKLAPYISALFLFTCLAGSNAFAQSSEQKIEGYTPPPMFGSPPVAQPRPKGPVIAPGRSSAPAPLPPVNPDATPAQPEMPGYVKPRLSNSNTDKPLKHEPYIPKFPPIAPVPMKETPGGQGKIVERARAPSAAPVPPKKPSAASVVTAPVSAPVAPAVTTSAQPAYKVTSKGVVTGPKTMPSVPTGGVEKEQTFTPSAQPESKTLLEQHTERHNAEHPQEAPAQKAAAPLPPLPTGFTPLAKIEPVDANKSRMTLPFTAGQDALAQDQLLTITHNITPIMTGDPGQRLQIQSYATPTSKGQNSDRRIALTRALAIRTALIEQGVEPRRIDVRALPAQNGQGPADRVELILSTL